MGTRILLFVITNLAIVVVLSIFMYILSSVFGINLMGGGLGGLFIFAAIIGFAGSFISLQISRWSAKRTYKIKPVEADEVSMLGEKERHVYDVVQDLADRHHITMPEVGFYESSEPNAFATGASKNKSLVAVSSGLLDTMGKDAIEGVVAHEMAHILNGDMVTMTLLQGVVNTFVIFAAKIIAGAAENFVDEKIAGMVRFAVDIFFQIALGFMASIITMKFSRYREFKADAGSARYVGKEKMIAGLQALKSMKDGMHPVRADGFTAMKISTGKATGIRALFSSHPPLDDRIKALEELIIH